MSTTKVLHVIARMNVGGTARYVGELVKNIPDSVIATGYVQDAELEDPIANGLPILRVPHMGRKISPINDFRSWLELRNLVRELKPEIIHTHTFKAGLIGRLISGNHKRVHTFHGHLFDDQSFSSTEKKVIILVERYLAKRTDFLISVGKRVGHELRSTGIGTNKEWASIPPGVKILPILNKTEARNHLKLDPGAFLVGWMARMVGVKNPLLAIEVAKRMPQVQFVMAGGGDLLEQVRQRAPENVTVIGWTDAATFWSAVDCAISTSDNEGMPIALIEAQLAGIPVVATNVGSNSEVIEDGVTGLVTKKDVSALVTGLLSIISDGSLLISMSLAAREFAERKFNLMMMLEAHAKIYANLLTNTSNCR